MADSEQPGTSNNIPLIRNPKLAKNRLYVSNLPICNPRQLESICTPYGRVLASHVQRNFGFVQYESEEIANKAATALNKSTFKGNVISVQIAANKNARNQAKTTQNVKPNEMAPAPAADYNDCEIIVINRQNTKYAEYIEDRLKKLGLRVDLLFPNEDVSLGKVLANISSRGCKYAVLITAQHEELGSITVNILYGVPAEHRNMPLEDAIKLIADDFRSNVQTAALPTLREPHPESIQVLLRSLINNMPLTVLQYDTMIKYLQERRTSQLQTQICAFEDEVTPDPEIELQKQILNILNKPCVTEVDYDLMYPDLDAVKKDPALMQLLRDECVIKAMNEIFNSDLSDTIAEYLN